VRVAETRGADGCCSYESLPPNFSLAANMAAGAFAGIAVRHTREPGQATSRWLMRRRNTRLCTQSICSRYICGIMSIEDCCGIELTIFADPNASRQSHTCRDIHWYRKCNRNNFESRGIHGTVAGAVKRDSGCRSEITKHEQPGQDSLTI
jgi:hypothetical protein